MQNLKNFQGSKNVQNVIVVNFANSNKDYCHISALKVKDVSDQFKEDLTNRGLASNTLCWYYDLFKHIERSYLMDKQIIDIDKNEIKKFLSIAEKKSNLGQYYSAKTMKSVRLVLSIFIDWCIEKNIYSSKNPCNDRSLRNDYGVCSINSTERWLPIKEFKNLIKFLTDNKRYVVIVKLLTITGLRIGELLALSWNDIDFKNKFIIVNKALKKHVEIINGKNKITYVIGKTKNKQSNRQVPLSDEAISLLEEWKNYLIKENKYINNIIFPNEDGRYHNYNTLQNNFQEYLVRQGYPGYRGHNVTFHMLRHTFGSVILENALNDGKTLDSTILVISRLLGHSSVRTTYDVYLGVHYDQKKSVIDKYTIK